MRRGHASQHVQLRHDVHQRALLDLDVALRPPGRQGLSVQAWMPGQGGVYGVDDAVRKIGLIGSVAVGVSKHDPVGAAAARTSTSVARSWAKRWRPVRLSPDGAPAIRR